jgi:hypothetical protein
MSIKQYLRIDIILLIYSIAVASSCYNEEIQKSNETTIPERYYESIHVVGLYTDEDLKEIIELITSLKEDPIIRISIPFEIADKYRKREISKIPLDVAEVMTGKIYGPLSGSGGEIYLKIIEGKWVVIGISFWIS